MYRRIFCLLAACVLLGCMTANAQDAAVVRGPEAAPAVAPVAGTVDVATPGVTQVALAAVVESETSKAEGLGLSRRQLRSLGFTRTAARVATIKLALQGELPSTRGLEGDELEAAQEEVREAIAAQIQMNHAEAWQSLKGQVGDGEGRDWAAFFEALADFLIKIQPFIEFIISLFSGL